MKFALILVVIMLGLGGLFFATKTDSVASSTTPKLSMQTIQNNVAGGGQLIDVRTPSEYTSGHIDGAINLSLQDMQVGTLPKVDKEKTVYVYCHSGNRSSQAATILKQAGYQDIVDLGAMTHVQSLGGVIKN